ncbi:response regulator transcription factor, partial [Saccharopolyspora kobensis]
GATGPRRRPKHGWESLTAAEHRVAELVAQGLTNREAAERLIVSVRTVDSHVSKILAKLGYASRVEIVLGFERRS